MPIIRNEVHSMHPSLNLLKTTVGVMVTSSKAQIHI